MILVHDVECDGPQLRGLGRFVWLGGRSYAPVEWPRMEQYVNWYDEWARFAPGDVDRDGDLDFVLASPVGLRALLKVAPGTWVDGAKNDIVCVQVGTADFNQDGAPDVVATSQYVNVEIPSGVYSNDGGANFSLISPTSHYFDPRCVDLDDDGDPDVVGADPNTDELVVWINEFATTSAADVLISTTPIQLHPSVVHPGEVVRMRLDPAHRTSTGSRALQIFDATGRVLATAPVAEAASEASWQVPTWFPAGRVWVGTSSHYGAVPLTILR